MVEEADYLVTDDRGSRNSWRHDKAYTQHPPKSIEDIDEEERMPFLVMMVSSSRRMFMILELLRFLHNGKSFVLNLEVKGASGFGNLDVANTIVRLVQGRNSERANC